jgi:hypothetical protein
MGFLFALELLAIVLPVYVAMNATCGIKLEWSARWAFKCWEGAST